MPDYGIVNHRLSSYSEAAALLPKLQQIYQQANEVADAITLYNANSNADFNAAVNAIFSAPERAQLAAMLINLQTLTNLWEAQHAALLDLDA